MKKKTSSSGKTIGSKVAKPGSGALLEVLESRFEENTHRHRGLSWESVKKKLLASEKKLRSLTEMEASGGEPDVIGSDKSTGEILFCDCAAESPTGRRSVCYDPEALKARKEHPPEDSAIGMARAMGIELLNEEQYRQLQTLGEFDRKTSSWLWTPTDVRARGGAIFGDLRYGRVFIYHNGADSYYAARGFRGLLRI